MKYNHKKMKKNGYVELIVETPVPGVKKGDKVFVTSTEFGQLDDDAMLSCITTDNNEIIIKKSYLKIESK